ncbi:hypothetical protein CK203_027369 [Vitis vinifera]|uniref:Retrovirus-related Pol polyprotein from transposon 297 n=1 Tax=Vitis vinifera TaxID=29760 RepID=A0A438J9C9_VITVI|nr:hypothetical protein CK203_027369 [Vitis vinifera]
MHVVPLPSGGIHHIDFIEDDGIHMLSGDDGLSEPIVLDDDYEVDTVGSQTSTPFSLILDWIRVETTTTPEGLIHMMMADMATCIVFLDDDFPLEGSDHTRLLYIIVSCLGHKVPSVLLDNGSALNICPLATAIALSYAPSDFGPSTQMVRAYDSTKRKVIGRPWIHRAEAIPSSFHQKVKFIYDRFTFDEVQTLEVEDFYGDFVIMSFDQHSSTVVLDMMRGMSFLSGMGLGRRQHGPIEFVATADHDTPFRLGSVPIEANYKGLEVHSLMGDFGIVTDIDGVDELQHQLHHLQLPRRSKVLALELMKDIAVGDDLLEGTISFIEEAPNFVDPPLSVDILSGFISRFDDMRGIDLFIYSGHTWMFSHGLKRICLVLILYSLAPLAYPTACQTSLNQKLRNVEVYVDDMIVKSRGRADHLVTLERFFERIRKFRLRLNPKKCNFGVTSGKLLGHMYISHFIARLTDICEPIFHLLRKNQPTVWNDDCQLAFEKIREYLLSPPVLVPPMSGRPLLLYLLVSDMALRCMLNQLNVSRKERTIYYLSKRMLEYEIRYVMTERLCISLVWATKDLKSTHEESHNNK